MKSSSALFTRQNPFPPPPRLGKVHYHPSRSQVLSKQKKKTALSPVRSTQRSNPQTQTQSSARKRPSNIHDAADAGGPVFSETWPSTDSGSTSPDEDTPKRSAGAAVSTVSSEPQGDSVMAKYIERFRHGQPQSREERQLEPLPLWWMMSSSSPPSSTPVKTAGKIEDTRSLGDEMVADILSSVGRCHRNRSSSPGKAAVHVLSDTSQGEIDDTEILNLQERANRLLLRGYEEDDESVPVSSDGVGCSDFSSPVSADEPMRQPVIPGFITSAAVKISSNSNQAMATQNSAIPSLLPPARPEEDILFQWRLRRKMEQAREWPLSVQHPGRHGTTVGWQVPDIHRPLAGEQAYRQQQSFQHPELLRRDPHPIITHHPQPPVPSASLPPPVPAFVTSGSPPGSQLQAVAHVPAHMHLLCDLLPCPIQLSQASAQKTDSQKSNEFHTNAVTTSPQVPGNSAEVLTEGPIRERTSSSTHVSSGAGKKEESELSKKVEAKKKVAASVQKQKKSTRYAAERTDVPSSSKGSSLHQRLPKKVIPPAETQQRRQQQQSQRVSTGLCSGTGDHPPSPSPINRALGKTVSEVLFPMVDSSPARRTSSANPPSMAPDTQNSVEVISQLLQEAEDSDEKEFEDDDLLQVLRKQRRWVKEQIREVESVLTEVLDERQVT